MVWAEAEFPWLPEQMHPWAPPPPPGVLLLMAALLCPREQQASSGRRRPGQRADPARGQHNTGWQQEHRRPEGRLLPVGAEPVSAHGAGWTDGWTDRRAWPRSSKARLSLRVDPLLLVCPGE